MSAKQFQVFSKGEAGRMHVLAHELTDQGRYELGHRVLGEWLEGKKGETSQDVHLHWHQGVFELAVSDWDAAYVRFCELILPAVERGEAATDAPAMLWRLRLDARRPTPLPWEVVRKYAIESLASEADRFVVLHDLLALAGAGDVDSIDSWLASPTIDEADGGVVLVRLGEGLRAFAAEDYGSAAAVFDATLPRLVEVGGSDAQRQLFVRMGRLAAARC
jgi:hypothetical protein